MIGNMEWDEGHAAGGQFGLRVQAEAICLPFSRVYYNDKIHFKTNTVNCINYSLESYTS